MKRTNLVLDEKLMEEAVHVLGVKTYSAAVNKSLEATIRLYKIRGLSRFMGSGAWEGDLAAMRGDAAKIRRKR